MTEANGLIVRCRGSKPSPGTRIMAGAKDNATPTHFDAMNDRCFGIWSSGGSPDSANVVRFIAARTVSRISTIRGVAPRCVVVRCLALTQGKLGVVGEVDVSGRGRSVGSVQIHLARISFDSHRIVEREVHVVVEARVGSGIEFGEASYDKVSAPQRIRPSASTVERWSFGRPTAHSRLIFQTAGRGRTTNDERTNIEHRASSIEERASSNPTPQRRAERPRTHCESNARPAPAPNRDPGPWPAGTQSSLRATSRYRSGIRTPSILSARTSRRRPSSRERRSGKGSARSPSSSPS
jgi:hypothetical protein